MWSLESYGTGIVLMISHPMAKPVVNMDTWYNGPLCTCFCSDLVVFRDGVHKCAVNPLELYVSSIWRTLGMAILALLDGCIRFVKSP